MKTFIYAAICAAALLSFSNASTAATSSPKELVLLTEGASTNLLPLVAAFEHDNGVKVKIVSQGKAELLDFLPTAPADVVITSVGDELEVAKRAGHLQPVTAKIEYDQIPLRFRDPQNYWIGYSYRVRSIFYDLNKVGDSGISNYEDIADPKWKGKLCTRTMDHKYNYAFVSWFLHTRGEAATRAWLTGMKNNLAVAPSGGDSGQAMKIAEGKCEVSITNSYYMGELLIASKTRQAASTLGIKLPNQANTGAFALVNSVAILKQAKNVKTANAFIAYLESRLGQQWVADSITTFPTRKDVVLKGFVKSYGESAGVVLPLVEPTSISTAVTERDAAIALIKEVGL